MPEAALPLPTRLRTVGLCLTGELRQPLRAGQQTGTQGVIMALKSTSFEVCLLACTTLLLSGCYKSDTDLLAGNKNAIELADSLFGYNGTTIYFEGSGDTIELCTARSKEEFGSGCSSLGTIVVERTRSGNYIVQKTNASGGYEYGIWYRSYAGSAGGAGRQCFEWLGNGLVGQSLEVTGSIRGAYPEFAQRVLSIAPNERIDRDQLLALTLAYELRFDADETCLGEWLFIDPATIVIDGDRRHIRAFD
jgi:hypothetical protein